MEQQAEPAAGSSQGAKEDTTKSMDGLSEYEMEVGPALLLYSKSLASIEKLLLLMFILLL